MARDPQAESALDVPADATRVRLHLSCDRCGASMVELHCKIICLNCGHRLDCSDLNIYFN